MFGKPADSIEQSIEDKDEYRIIDSSPITNRFVTTGTEDNSGRGSEAQGPNCANFIAGIIEGIFTCTKMFCKCRAHFVKDEEEQAEIEGAYSDDGRRQQSKFYTLYVIKFDAEVAARDAQIN